MTEDLAPKPSDLEDAACDLCAAPTPAVVAFKVRGFSVVRCPGCKVLRVSPRLTAKALQAYYAAPYWASQDSVTRGYFNYPGDEVNIRRTFRRRLRTLARIKPAPGRLLDVGCAFGFLVEEALAAGWDAYGIEWSAHAAAKTKGSIRTRIEQGGLTQTPQAQASFDVITMWDYLEHSPHPRQDMKKACQMLKPGGLLSVIIPDAGSWLARWLGPRWEEYKKPQEHLYFFTGAQLAYWLQTTGFKPILKERAGKYASLDFAFSRFQPGDGLMFLGARAARRIIRLAGMGTGVMYINPRDKLHLLCQKEPA